MRIRLIEMVFGLLKINMLGDIEHIVITLTDFLPELTVPTPINVKSAMKYSYPLFFLPIKDLLIAIYFGFRR